jgi:hypothetical protein
MRQPQGDSTRASETDQLARKLIRLCDDISPRDAKIEDDACDAGECHQPSNLRRALGQKLGRVSQLLCELVKVGLADHDVQSGFVSFTSVGLGLREQAVAATKYRCDVPTAVGDERVNVEVRTRRSQHCGRRAPISIPAVAGIIATRIVLAKRILRWTVWKCSVNV